VASPVLIGRMKTAFGFLTRLARFARAALHCGKRIARPLTTSVAVRPTARPFPRQSLGRGHRVAHRHAGGCGGVQCALAPEPAAGITMARAPTVRLGCGSRPVRGRGARDGLRRAAGGRWCIQPNGIAADKTKQCPVSLWHAREPAPCLVQPPRRIPCAFAQSSTCASARPD
jgi:hypothetical protein